MHARRARRGTGAKAGADGCVLLFRHGDVLGLGRARVGAGERYRGYRGVLVHDHKLPDVEWYRQRTMEQDPWYKANEDWWAAKDNGTTISVPPPLPRNETEYAYLKEEEEEKVLESNDDPWYLSTTSTQTDYPYGGSD